MIEDADGSYLAVRHARQPADNGLARGKRGIDAKRRVAREGVEVGIAVQDRQVGADGQRADEAVDENANGLAPTAALPIERRRLIEVAGLHRNEHGARDEPPEIDPMATCTVKRPPADSIRTAGGRLFRPTLPHPC